MEQPAPYPFQLEGVKLITKFKGRALLADQMGLGKSRTSLLWMRKHNALPALVICPASLKLNWQREAWMWTKRRAIVLDGTRPGKSPLDETRLNIINYDILGSWMDKIEELNPRLVIIDEAQACKNRRTLRSKFTKAICKRAEFVIALSGTPLTNRPAELWPILNILRPDLYSNFMGYALKFCAAKKTRWGNRWGWDVKGSRNLPELHSNLVDQMMIRRLKSDVLKELPEKSRSIVTLPMQNESEYREAEKDLIGWLSKKYNPTRAKKAMRSERMVRMGYLKRLAAELKLQFVIDWIDTFLEDTDEKLIVFGIHKKILKTLHHKFANESVIVTGDTPLKLRQFAVDKFQNHGKTRLFLGNIQAAGVGITLTASSTVAFAELGWTPGEHIQGEDRAHRIGATQAVQCYYLVAGHSIESRLCELLQTKQAVLDTVLDGIDENQNGSTLNIFDQLQKELTKCPPKRKSKSKRTKKSRLQFAM